VNPSGDFRFSAVVLAAGTSSRMQGRNKLLLPLAGEPAIRRTVRAVLAAGPQETVVVTGHRREEVEAALAGLAVRLHAHADFEQGQMTSVSAGIGALSRATDAVLVCLGDMALLRPEDYREIVAAHASRLEKSFLVPMVGGRRGNPVAIAQWRLPEIIAGRRNLGCRKLIDDNPDDVHAYEASNERFVLDMDTPEDYEAMAARFWAGAGAPERERS
jgi:molybdenum cofactor cytidylyltransferase